jgi:S1-C subfamily serine protease
MEKKSEKTEKTVTIQKEEKKTSKKSKVRSPQVAEAFRRKITLLLIVFMTVVGFFAGWLSYEKFIDKDVVEEPNDSTKTTIVVDGDETVNVVAQSMNSVVSIAVNSNTYSETDGVVSNIGSGFIVDADGLVLTNQHVVSSQNVDYIVVTADGEEYMVEEIQRDDVNDIALLKIKLEDGAKLEAISLGDSDKLNAGQYVIAIGTPLGEYAGSVTTGVVSGLNRSVSTSSGNGFYATQKTFENVIQTDAAVNPGNSGGPLLDGEGLVIGINFATTSGADNISFAIPINFVKDRLEEYRKYGKFRHPSLGVAYETVTPYQARFYKDLVAGALVVGLDENGPAATAGIEKFDVITSINGEDFEGALREVILSHDIGDTLKLSIWRAGEELTIEVELGEVK